MQKSTFVNITLLKVNRKHTCGLWRNLLRFNTDKLDSWIWVLQRKPKRSGIVNNHTNFLRRIFIFLLIFTVFVPLRNSKWGKKSEKAERSEMDKSLVQVSYVRVPSPLGSERSWEYARFVCLRGLKNKRINSSLNLKANVTIIICKV